MRLISEYSALSCRITDLLSAKSEAGTPIWAVFAMVSALSAITAAISWLVNMQAAIETQAVKLQAAIATKEAQLQAAIETQAVKLQAAIETQQAAIETQQAKAEALVWKNFFELASTDPATMKELLNAAAAAKKRGSGSG